MISYAVFETAIGWAGLAWGEKGLVGACLPERDPAIARASFARRFRASEEAAPPPVIADVAEGIRALMRGEKTDLSDAPLDLARVSDSTRRSIRSRGKSRPARR